MFVKTLFLCLQWNLYVLLCFYELVDLECFFGPKDLHPVEIRNWTWRHKVYTINRCLDTSLTGFQRGGGAAINSSPERRPAKLRQKNWINRKLIIQSQDGLFNIMRNWNNSLGQQNFFTGNYTTTFIKKNFLRFSNLSSNMWPGNIS